MYVSFGSVFSHTKAQQEPTAETMEEDKCSHEGEEEETLPQSYLKALKTSDAQTATTSSADETRGRDWWISDVLRDSGQRSDHSPSCSSSRWDFSSIIFPDLGSSEHLLSGLASPDPSVLPEGLAVGLCDVALWKQKINLCEVKMSSKEQEREKEQQRRRWDVNKDKEVCVIKWLVSPSAYF